PRYSPGCNVPGAGSRGGVDARHIPQPGVARPGIRTRARIAGQPGPAERPLSRREAGGRYRDILERLRAVPGVGQASSSMITPMGRIMWNQEITVDGYTASSRDDATVFFNRVSDGYFETLHTPMLAGRDFNNHDGAGSGLVAIVNQTMAEKFFAGRGPLGGHFRMHDGPTLGPPIEIIGVVKDAKYQTLREETLPTAYVPAAQE